VKKKKALLRARFTFCGGGSQDVVMSLEDLEEHSERQTALMLASPYRAMQRKGEKRRKDARRRLAKERETAIRARLAAKAPRPRRKSPITREIVGLMRRARARDMSFKDFFRAWLNGPRGGMRIWERSGRCVVENEAGETAGYARDTLEKTLWSRSAAKKKP
jgi:hypothetical protein